MLWFPLVKDWIRPAQTGRELNRDQRRRLKTLKHHKYIEQLFKDGKSGGYNLEDTQVNERRFLALVLLVTMAYSLATLEGQWLRTRCIHQ